MSVLIYVFILLQFVSTFIKSQNLQIRYKRCQDNSCRTSPGNDSENQNYQYDNEVLVFQNNQVASDFGPRRLGNDHYDWHGGIDYSSQRWGLNPDEDRGDLIYSLRSGDIPYLVDCFYKYVFVQL